MSSRTLVCFDCQTAYRADAYAERICAKCHRPCWPLPWRWRIPKRGKIKEWERLRAWYSRETGGSSA